MKQPFPSIQGNKDNGWIITGVSVFIAVFLLLFQPFGLNHGNMPYKSLFLMGYGGVTFIVLLLLLIIVPMLFRKFFKETNWTVGKHILWVTLILLTIGTGNFIYTFALTDQFAWQWQSFFLFQFFTLAVGIIPVSLITLWDYNRKLRENLREATQFNERLQQKHSYQRHEDQEVKLTGRNKEESFRAPINKILYIQSAGNYVQIQHQTEKGLYKSMLRNTLTEVRDQLPAGCPIIQCHRAYLVNTRQILKAQGNAQGFKLQLHSTEETIPVSRKYVPRIRENLSHQQA